MTFATASADALKDPALRPIGLLEVVWPSGEFYA